MMLLKACIEVFLLCVSCVSYAQMGMRERVVFYNTENLFDTRNDTLTADDDFTPRKTALESGTLYRKLLNISKVLNGLWCGKVSATHRLERGGESECCFRLGKQNGVGGW